MEHILRCHEMVKTDFVRAEGCTLYDAQGQRYTDFEAGIWCTALGHNHPRVQRALCDQIGKVIHLGTRYPSPLAEAAAVALLEVTGLPDGKCTFLSSGSEAVEFGVQAARRVTGRSRLLTFKGSYLAAYGSAGQKNPQEWLYFDRANCAGCEHAQTCAPDCPHIAALPCESLAAFVYDGGNASGQVRLPPPGLVPMLTRKVREQGGLLVANEITAGMGRTGAWFGYQHEAVQPDIVAVGKGLGNGYPVSAAVLSPQVAGRLERDGLGYAQSHQNDPLGCAVAREVLAVMHEEGLVERSRRVGAGFLEALSALARRAPGIREVRGRGLMIVMEMEAGQPGLAVARLYHQLLERGFLAGYTPAADLLRFYPALTIGENEIGCLVETLEAVILAGSRVGATEVI